MWAHVWNLFHCWAFVMTTAKCLVTNKQFNSEVCSVANFLKYFCHFFQFTWNRNFWWKLHFWTNSVKIFEFLCISDFTWNQFWWMVKGENYNFAHFIASRFWSWWISDFPLGLQMTKLLKFLKNWFHANSEWQKFS